MPRDLEWYGYTFRYRILKLLNWVISIFAAYYFRKYGFLAAVGIHFWTDIIWHVIWGIIY
jgi:hypothetical protein